MNNDEYRTLLMSLRSALLRRAQEELEKDECNSKWGDIACRYLEKAGIVQLEQETFAGAKSFLDNLELYDPDAK